MYYDELKNKVFFEPLGQDVNQLYIISGYATPNMASWLIKNIKRSTEKSIDIHLIVGMVPYDGLSVPIHNGFVELMTKELPAGVNSFTCSYVFEGSPVHSKVYIWSKDGKPVYAFSGSANFTQPAFSSNRREVIFRCNPEQAMEYFNRIESDCIYCNHAEVEEYIILYPVHTILDRENKTISPVESAGIPSVTLSLLARGGETGRKSGLNWGQRKRRNPNEAYIPLPAKIARSGFFPLEETHFTVVTDDGHNLILRVEQENNKAITTPLSNAQLGEYFRNRLGLANGEYVWKQNLLNYGRTDVTFYKLDDEQYYMDFSV